MTKYKTTKTDNNYYMLMKQSVPSIIFKSVETARSDELYNCKYAML